MRVGLFVGTFVSLVACGDSAAVADSDLIGGTDDTAELTAVGALTRPDDEKQRNVYCTATLIAPTVVVTAKHCASNDFEGKFKKVRFELGPKQGEFTRSVDIVKFEESSLHKGGAIGRGNDVAFGVLAKPVDDVVPWKLGDEPLGASDVGTTFGVAGYGIFDNESHASGVKRMTELRLAYIEGSPIAQKYGTVDAFFDVFLKELPATDKPWLDPNANPVFAEESKRIQHDVAKKLFDIKLLAGSDVFLEPINETSGQVCSGDSGGPVFRRAASGNEVVAVNSGGYVWNQKCLRYGSAAATFGKPARAAATKALAATP